MSQPPLHCSDRSGFLFAHACDRLPAAACSRCTKPICVEHTRTTPTGPTCISCLRRGDSDRSSRDSSSSSSSASPSTGTAAAAAAGIVAAGTFGGAGATGAWTGPGEGGTRDDPYFYGGEAERAAYYDADDFRAFDTAAADATSAADAPESDTGAS